MASPRGPERRSDPLTRQEVAAVSTALLSNAAAAEKIAIQLLNAEPALSSPAGTWWSQRDRSIEPDPIMGAFLSMQYALLSGADHLRAFNKLIRNGPPPATALVTVARGAIEAFARNWYLATATSASEFYHRQLSALYDELKYPERLDDRVYTRDGEPLDVARRREQLLDQLRRMGLPSPSRVEISSQVAAMLDVALQNEGGRLSYSTLSSVAHAHRLGINAFIYTDGWGRVLGLTVMKPTLADVLTLAVLSASESTTSTVHVFGDNPAAVRLTEIATERTADAIASLGEEWWNEE